MKLKHNDKVIKIIPEKYQVIENITDFLEDENQRRLTPIERNNLEEALFIQEYERFISTIKSKDNNLYEQVKHSLPAYAVKVKVKGGKTFFVIRKAGEYSYWACNFYVGCSNGCTYCYCKKGILAGAMGQDKPKLKKCFKDEEHAISVFIKELLENIDELRKHGLFFSFTTDPMLPETFNLTWLALAKCIDNQVPVKILTKCTQWVTWQRLEEHTFEGCRDLKQHERKMIAFGFTLTGHDELESGASTNAERIEAMKKLHDAGFKTWASIEPVIDFDSSMTMIEQSMRHCDLYKIGLMSGSKPKVDDLKSFVSCVNWYGSDTIGFKVYWKNSISKFFTTNMWEESCYVNRDYNIFTS